MGWREYMVDSIEFGCNTASISVLITISPSSPIYKKHLIFLIHCINDVFGLYNIPHTSFIE